MQATAPGQIPGLPPEIQKWLQAGATMLPAMPAFYQMPKTLADLADFMAGKILSSLGFEHDLYPEWTGQV